ncbi:hypothetical protein NC99_30410 [Sunxiuqinia dokdonensis]|uniref:Uncharacterized protein n=1 Tax=Sunxiuqinia dokdonensis TaxID=1409788 RepID=A0A0L8V6Q7_9BACT|nr:hypothetical protein NC99_30410 [Sunxiuqinia dokdonensis]
MIVQISIPVWCDWWLTSSEVSDLYNSFQFQYGAIGGDGGVGIGAVNDKFQFQYGAIGGFSMGLL